MNEKDLKQIYEAIMMNSFEFTLNLEVLEENEEEDDAKFLYSQNFTAIAVNTAFDDVFAYGEELKKYDIVLTFKFTNGAYTYNIRSNEHNICKVIAETFNGKGDTKASEFSLPFNMFDSNDLSEELDYEYCALNKYANRIEVLISNDDWNELIELGEITIGKIEAAYQEEV